MEDSTHTFNTSFLPKKNDLDYTNDNSYMASDLNY